MVWEIAAARIKSDDAKCCAAIVASRLGCNPGMSPVMIPTSVPRRMSIIGLCSFCDEFNMVLIGSDSSLGVHCLSFLEVCICVKDNVKWCKDCNDFSVFDLFFSHNCSCYGECVFFISCYIQDGKSKYAHGKCKVFECLFFHFSSLALPHTKNDVRLRGGGGTVVLLFAVVRYSNKGFVSSSSSQAVPVP